MNHSDPRSLPGRFRALVEKMPPRAIEGDEEMETTLEMIDRLMAIGKATRGQARYLETLVQLVEVYEARHHAIHTSDLSGVESLRYLLDESGMNASDLARLLGVHVSMGSKLLRGERALTVAHIQTLAEHFKVRPDLFLAGS